MLLIFRQRQQQQQETSTFSTADRMKGISLRITIKDTCVALLEGTLVKKESSQEEPPQYRVESACIIHLDRLACHHTSETSSIHQSTDQDTDQDTDRDTDRDTSNGSGSHQVSGTVVAASGLECT